MNQRYRNPATRLTGVVQSEPLLGEVAPSVHHKLRAEYASDRPPGHQRRHQRIAKARRRRGRPPPALQEQANGQGQCDPPETGQSALPEGQPATGMPTVVTPVGRQVSNARTHQSTHDEGGGVAREGLEVDAPALESASGVPVGGVGREREPKAVHVERQGAEA